MTFFKDATVFGENTLKQEFLQRLVSTYAVKRTGSSDHFGCLALEGRRVGQLEPSTHYNDDTRLQKSFRPTRNWAASPSHHQLSLSASGEVVADEMGTKGLHQRNAVLEAKLGVDRAKAVDAKAILNSSRSELREMFKGSNSIYYIYHNTIDAIGDHAASESHVFGLSNLHSRNRSLIDKSSTESVPSASVTADAAYAGCAYVG